MPLLLDIGMILLIVVLPAVIFLATPNSRKSEDTKKDFIADKLKSEGQICAVTFSHRECHKAFVHRYDKCFVQQLGFLPDELQAQVAQYVNLRDVAAVTSSCQHMRQALHTVSVWQTLGCRYGICTKNPSINQCKDEVRLAAWRMDFKSIKDLAIEVKRHPPGASTTTTAKLLAEASRFVQRLLPSDGDLAMELCELLRPPLNCHGSECANEAKDFMQSARQSVLPWVALQDLESSYGHGLLQHNVFESCMQEHEDMLTAQLFEFDASLIEESKLQLDQDWDILLSI